jgi:DNA polymerase-1
MTSRAPIFWDYETHLIKPGMPAPRLVCAAFTDPDGSRMLLDRERGLDRVEEVLDREVSGGHHIFYDLGVSAAERPDRMLPRIFGALDQGRLHCTKIRQMMIDNARGELKFIWNEETEEFNRQNYELARLIQRHLGYDVAYKKKGAGIWRLRYRELDGVPIEEYPEEAYTYPLDDASDAQKVWISQQQRDIEPEEIPGYDSQMQAAWALLLLGTWGLRTDAAMVREYRAELTVDYEAQIKICQQFGFRRDNVKRSRDMKAIRSAVESWYKDAGREMKLTKGGDIATDREQLTDTKHPGLVAVAESVKLEKQLTTYVAALERGAEVPLNPNYNPIIETFRTSCSGGMKVNGVPVGMNVQNLPRGGRVRECVIPRPGNVFAFCDYDTLEMLTLAQVCLDLFGYSEIANAALAGIDFHTALAADMMGISYKTALARIEDGDSVMVEARQYCKIGNYGFSGGMGPDAFISYAKGAGIEVSYDLACKLHAAFRKRWPEVVQYFQYCSFLCDGGNAKQVVFVRSGMVRGDVRYTAVCNGFFQHLAAMGAKRALYNTVKECYIDRGSPLYDCRPWLFAHDEIGMEIPSFEFGPDRTHDAAMRLHDVMVDAMKFWCPDVPIHASVALTRRWYKGAKAKKDNRGRLIPVKPRKIDLGNGKYKTEWIADAA